MEISERLFLIMAMMLIAIIVEPIAKWIKLSYSAALVLVGFVGSELIVAQGFDTGIRWHSFQDLVFYILIPILVFDSAFRLNLRLLLHNLVHILSLAIPLMLLASAITAVIVYYGIAHPRGFPWIAALIAGVLLSATDPVAVVSMLKQNKAPEKLEIILEGESLFNDATAIVVFGILISMAQSGNHTLEWDMALIHFSIIFFGGIAIGVVIAGIAALFIRFTNRSEILGVISLVSAYFSFLLAEDIFHFSGVMAVLSYGLLFGEIKRRHSDNNEWNILESLWNFNAYVANAMIFLLAGMTITLAMFTDRWLAMLIGIIAVSIARIISVYGGISLLGWIPKISPISRNHRIIITFGGVRGAVTLALALALPLDLEYWFSIQSIAYGVVLFTLFIQAPIMAQIIRRYS